MWQLHAESSGGGRGGAAVVGLDAAAGDQRVDIVGERLRGDEPELPDLVPAEAEGEGVVALDHQARTHADGLGESGRLVDGSRKRAECEVRKGEQPIAGVGEVGHAGVDGCGNAGVLVCERERARIGAEW